MEQENNDVSTIHDEDVLRRMWQQTEDFGRKKEIRAHMYKLRETRLKEFYTSGEVLKDVQRSNSSPGLRDQHTKPAQWTEGPTHADSLADHSFLSLKSKEIRDSESPTREVQFRNSKNRCDDGTWTISSKTEKSKDGKTITNTQLATTQGSEPLEGGNLSYAAINEQKASVYSDGDANNFTKSVGETSKTFAEQQMTVGDDQNFRSSKSTSKSTSSKVVSHHSSTTGNLNIEDQSMHGRNQEGNNSSTSITRKIISSDDSNNQTGRQQLIDDGKCSTVVTRTIHSSELPDDLKKSIIDGNTKVITETKTLPDGSTVTTTRYETKGSKKWSSTSGSTQSQVTSNRQVVEQRDNKQIEYNTTGGNQRTIVTTQVDSHPRNVNKNENIRIIKSERHVYDDDIKTGNHTNVTKTQENIHNIKNVQDQSKITRTREDTRDKVTEQDVKVTRRQDTHDDAKRTNNEIIKVTKTILIDNGDHLPATKRKQIPDSHEIQTTVTTTKTTVKSGVDGKEPLQSRPQEKEICPARSRPEEKQPLTSQRPSSPPNRPQEIELTRPIKPQNEPYKASTPTNDQYTTTYRQEYTTKRVSVDVSPTHDAFVRSLRAISPDRVSDRPKSRGSVRNSTSSLRSSTSPEKSSPHPSRKSPACDRRSPDKYVTENKRRHTTSPSRPSEYSPERRYPNKKETSPPKTRSPERISPERTTTVNKSFNSDTITRKKTTPSRKSPERPIQNYSPVRSTSPTKTMDRTSPTKPTDVTITTKTVTRNQTSPIRGISPTKSSPARSPTKPNTTIEFNSDTITRKKKVPSQDVPDDVITTKTGTITRKKDSPKPSTTCDVDTVVISKDTKITTQKSKRPTSRDASPTTSASDIEFINHNSNSHIVTDLDEPLLDKRPTTLDINVTTTTTTKKTKQTNNKPTEIPKHPSSPVKESPRQKSPTKASPTKEKSSPVKEVPKRNSYQPSELDSPSDEPPTMFPVSPEEIQPVDAKPSSKEPKDDKEKPPLKRTETYEERCRMMLGLPEVVAVKKEVPDEYAGRTPVEEPIFVKKHIDFGWREDELIQENVEKMSKHRPTFRPDKDESKPKEDTKEFILTERDDNITKQTHTIDESKPTSIIKKPNKERKSPEKQKPKDKQPDDGEYITEYTDEYCEKPTSRRPSGQKLPEEKISKPKDRKPSLPERKSPQKKPKESEPEDGEYETEYTNEYCEKPTTQKVTSKTTIETSKIIPYKKPGRDSPEKKIPRDQKNRPDDKTEFTTEYTDEYCETTKKETIIAPKKPTPQENITTKISPTNKQLEKSPIRESSPKKKPEKKKPKENLPKQDDTTDDEEIIDAYYVTEKGVKSTTDIKINRKSPSPVRRIHKEKSPVDDDIKPIDRHSPSRTLPDNKTVSEYINEFCETTKVQPERITTDFISKEKNDTDITFALNPRKNPEPKEKSPNRQIPDVEFEIENEQTQKTHIRTHRIDTNEVTRETSPKRQPQRAVPSDTMECTFKKTTTTIENGFPKKEEKPIKKLQKPSTVEERKILAKPKDIKKDSSITKTTKIITKKTSAKDIDVTKKRMIDESPKKKSPTDDKPSKIRSPSPSYKTVTKKVVEAEHTTRKCSHKDIPIKKTPDAKKPLVSRTTSESPVRKPLQYSSPERKPIKQIPKSSPKEQTQPKPSEPIKKHITSKLISLTKPHPSSPKTITTIKTSKMTQPTSITVTKVTKKTIKHTKEDIEFSESDSETEIIDVTSRVDKKKVVTTANIKITIPKQEKSRPEVTMPAIKRSTSSREQSPDKICPIPVSSEDEGSYPRYPDQVSEPDDVPYRKKPQRITDIPLTEEEDVKDFSRITEVTVTRKQPSTRITNIDKVMDTDESLLSVTEKVSRFINTAEKLTEDEVKSKKPAPKVPRPELVVGEDLEDDECLLSVSDKVTKFISTADQVPVKKSERPHSPIRNVKVEENDECLLSVNEKVTHFIHAAETTKQKPSSKDGPAPKVNRPNFTEIDERLKTDECLLSVSDKVSKFLTTAEKLTTTEVSKTKTELPEKRERSPDKIKQDTPVLRHSPSRKSPEVTIRKSPEVTVRKSPKPEPIIEPSHPKSEPIETKTINLKSSEAVRKAKEMFESISKTQEVPKQRDILTRPSIWEGRKKPDTKPIEDNDVKLTDIGVYHKKEPTSEVKKQLVYNTKDDETCRRISTNLKDVTLKSTKLILNEKKRSMPDDYDNKSPEREMKPTRAELPSERKSKSPERDSPGYMKPIPKISTEDRDKYIIETRLRSTFSPERETSTFTEHKESETLYKTKHHLENGDMPHYMLPLQRGLTPERDARIHRKSTTELHEQEEQTLPVKTPEREIPGYMRPLQRNAPSPDEDTTDDGPKAGKKFGVTLRRTDSGRMITTTSSTTTTTTERRRSSVSGQPNVEEILDLELLEKMMDKVIGYEQRRRIRAQIRVVRRLISENKITVSGVRRSPVKQTSSPIKEPLGYKSCDQERRSPTRDSPKRPATQTKKPVDTKPKEKISNQTEYNSSYTRSSQKSESTIIRDRTTSPDSKKSSPTTDNRDRSMSPDAKKKPSYKPDLKQVPLSSKSIQEDKPSWVTNRNLKKTAAETTTTRIITSPIVKKKEIPRRSPSPQKPIDCITSSYGIGPTDENGLPLFGIKALRKATADKVHVRGTVVTSQFYSENGAEPVGEVTVTKYSTDPKELAIDDEHHAKSKGLTSITTTQKFGTRGTPTLGTLIDKKKAITEKHSEEDEILKSTTTKVSRRGSVKALSQKFIENAAEISRSERQVYPKAGLILRTSSFKDSTERSGSRTDRSSSRESSPGLQARSGKISLESITSDSRDVTTSCTTQRREDTKTFLNSHTRVTNAQDVISRMKNAETEHHEGDTEEDREARMLLNKFLGAQVLMSGMEPLLANQTAVTSSAQLVRKVQKTKTTSSSTSSTTTNAKDSGKQISLTKRFQCPITVQVLQDIWDEQTLRALLEQCTDYEERRAIRARLRQVMAEQEAVANVVASAVSERDTTTSDSRTQSSMQERVESTKKTFSEGPITTTQVSSRVISTSRQVGKPISPFAKFRQLDKQNSLNTPPSSPRTPTGSGAPLFKFTDPALSQSASTVKDRLLHWCQMKTKEYQNIKLDNFSTSWADGMAFCALIHHFLPDAFDYHVLTPQHRRHNFTLAFKVADEQADIAPLLDVDDMVAMRRPDWKCVFTYVQSIYRRFKDED